MDFQSAYILIGGLVTETATGFDSETGLQETEFDCDDLPALTIYEQPADDTICLVSPVDAPHADAQELLSIGFLGEGTGAGCFARDARGQLVFRTELSLAAVNEAELETRLGEHLVFAALSEYPLGLTDPEPPAPSDDTLMLRA